MVWQEPKLVVAKYYDERRRRKQVFNRKDSEIALPDPKFKKQLGEHTILDLPQDEPWQLRVFEETGELYEYGKPYYCPRCGHGYHKAFPPEVCRICGTPGPLSKIRRGR